jgi:hypothetical protein
VTVTELPTRVGPATVTAAPRRGRRVRVAIAAGVTALALGGVVGGGVALLTASTPVAPVATVATAPVDPAAVSPVAEEEPSREGRTTRRSASPVRSPEHGAVGRRGSSTEDVSHDGGASTGSWVGTTHTTAPSDSSHHDPADDSGDTADTTDDAGSGSSSPGESGAPSSSSSG